MKVIKVGFGVLAVAVFVSWFNFGTAYAQDFNTVWQNKWLKLNVVMKGNENSPGGPGLVTLTGRFPAFLKVLNWDASPPPFLNADLWVFDDDGMGWTRIPIQLNYITGTPLDFLTWTQNDTGVLTTGVGEMFTFTARITARLSRDGQSIQTATFKCLGGSFLEINPTGNTYEAAGMTMTGTLVPATFCNSLNNKQYPPCQPPQPE